MSIICEMPSIRDVIAFPKSGNGKELMSGAPAPLPKEDLEYYHLAQSQPSESEETVRNKEEDSQ